MLLKLVFYFIKAREDEKLKSGAEELVPLPGLGGAQCLYLINITKICPSIQKPGGYVMKIIVILLLSLLSIVTIIALPCSAGEVFSVNVGDFKVSMISEAQRDGKPDILIGASEADVAKFMPDGKYPSAVAAYLIQSPDGAVMVDTGFGREIPRVIGSLGVALDDVRAVLITHAHGDHIGGLISEGKPAFPNAKVLVSRAEYEWSEQLRNVLGKYDGRFETVTPGTLESGGVEVLRGVRAIAAYGHTPGHTMFLVESGGDRLLIWGDLTHAMAIQMPRPGVSVTYDADPEAVAGVRAGVLRYVAENGIPVAGMHVAYPGMGYVSKDDDNPGGYSFLPKNN
jgi:glyoxylase-like metal-dependent hydrolase (beta-lactamase superfamily II)